MEYCNSTLKNPGQSCGSSNDCKSKCCQNTICQKNSVCFGQYILPFVIIIGILVIFIVVFIVIIICYKRKVRKQKMAKRKSLQQLQQNNDPSLNRLTNFEIPSDEKALKVGKTTGIDALVGGKNLQKQFDKVNETDNIIEHQHESDDADGIQEHSGSEEDHQQKFTDNNIITTNKDMLTTRGEILQETKQPKNDSQLNLTKENLEGDEGHEQLDQE